MIRFNLRVARSDAKLKTTTTAIRRTMKGVSSWSHCLIFWTVALELLSKQSTVVPVFSKEQRVALPMATSDQLD